MTFAGEIIGDCRHCGMEARLSDGACIDCLSHIERSGNTPTWSEIIKLELRVMDLESRFRHRHIDNGIDDTCQSCGLDLRDTIHERMRS